MVCHCSYGMSRPRHTSTNATRWGNDNQAQIRPHFGGGETGSGDTNASPPMGVGYVLVTHFGKKGTLSLGILPRRVP